MITTSLTPGVYRVSELAERLNVSRSSVERYIERFSLEIIEISHKNKMVRGVVLDEQTLERLQEHIRENIPGAPPRVDHVLFTEQPHGGPTVSQERTMDTPPIGSDEKDGLSMSSPMSSSGIPFGDYQALQERLLNAEIERARLEGELLGLRHANEVLKRSNETLEKTLQASFILESRKQEHAITMVPEQQPTSSPSFLAKLKRTFLGGG